MEAKPFSTIGIVGSGFMGAHIGLQCALSGYEVWLLDSSPASLERALQFAAAELGRRVEAGQLSEAERASTLSRLRVADDWAHAARQLDLAIEAVPERLDIKREVFAQLDKLCPPRTVLATNSSSYRISELEDVVERQDKVLNLHFMGEVWRRPAVEIMRGSQTTDEVVAKARRFVRSLGLVPLQVRKESTGFIFNRIWRAVKKETLRVLAEGVSTPDDVDRAWMLVMGAPMGPCAMMDMVGLDVVRDIEMAYYRQSGDPSDLPPRFLLDKIERGELGVKTGRGFYTYPNPAWQEPGWLQGESYPEGAPERPATSP